MPPIRFLAALLVLIPSLFLGTPVLASPSLAEFPREWFWGDDDQRAIHQSLQNRPMDLNSLGLTEWHNGQPGDLTGQVVVIDFWATWCGPCLNAIPKLNKLNAMDGVTVVGICGSGNGQDRMVEVANAHKMTYPTARDASQSAARDWSVRWWPTYILLDKRGTVRAIGLSTDHVEDAVKVLLFEEVAPAEKPAANLSRWSVRPEWQEGSPERRQSLEAIQGKPAPSLQAVEWTNTNASSLDDMRGNIVVLDFWATWCGPCIASIPKNNELAAKYQDRGVVFLGVCHPEGGEKMAETAKEHGIRFPYALDKDGTTIRNFQVDSFPDYYIIGRDGTLLVADVNNAMVENVIETLLADEAARESAPRPTGNAWLPGEAQGNTVPLEARTGQLTIRE